MAGKRANRKLANPSRKLTGSRRRAGKIDSVAGLMEMRMSCNPILFFPLLCRETFVIFSGGLPQDRPGRSSSISVVHGRNTTVLEMEHNVVDFITLCQSPWPSGNYFL